MPVRYASNLHTTEPFILYDLLYYANTHVRYVSHRVQVIFIGMIQIRPSFYLNPFESSISLLWWLLNTSDHEISCAWWTSDIAKSRTLECATLWQLSITFSLLMPGCNRRVCWSNRDENYIDFNVQLLILSCYTFTPFTKPCELNWIEPYALQLLKPLYDSPKSSCFHSAIIIQIWAVAREMRPKII